MPKCGFITSFNVSLEPSVLSLFSVMASPTPGGVNIG